MSPTTQAIFVTRTENQIANRTTDSSRFNGGNGAVSSVVYDVVIIGGGVIGCGTARALSLREPGLKICLLEKEPELALHQSGRNSGVVHVGYNQKPGTMKARFVVE